MSLVSIALCTYNGDSFLEEQLESIINQTYTNLEIIAIDDCSTDETWSILERYTVKDKRLKIYRNTANIGLRGNFERAFLLCRGEYIAPSDQDDIWLPEKIQILMRAIGTHSAVYCDSLFTDSHNISLGYKASDVWKMYSGRNPLFFTFVNCASGHAMLIRRSLLSTALPIPPLRYYDWWLAFVAASTAGIKHQPQVLVRFRRHQNALTNRSAKPLIKSRNRPKSAEQIIDDQVLWIRTLSRISGKHQHYFSSLANAWVSRKEKWFNFRLMFLLCREKRYFFWGKTNGVEPLTVNTIVRLAIGIPVRRFFFPSRYPVDADI